MADLLTLQEHRQAIIDNNLRIANSKRVRHDYAVGEKVLMRSDASRKLDPVFKGPFEITRCHTNGTVRLQLKPNQSERVNIRRIKPYREATDNELVIAQI